MRCGIQVPVHTGSLLLFLNAIWNVAIGELRSTIIFNDSCCEGHHATHQQGSSECELFPSVTNHSLGYLAWSITDPTWWSDGSAMCVLQLLPSPVSPSGMCLKVPLPWSPASSLSLWCTFRVRCWLSLGLLPSHSPWLGGDHYWDQRPWL